MTEQQGDVQLFQTTDGGEITVELGVAAMDGGLGTAVYLSLVGGNENDSTREGDPANWWGNLGETLPERQYRSQFQYLLARLPAIPANLRRLEDAAARDLAWLQRVDAASKVEVSASIPALNRVKMVIYIEAFGERAAFTYTENWAASA